MTQKTITISSTEAMKELGALIGEQLIGGECLELIGDVGAGKTTFTKGLALGLGVDEDVQSPSFTISRVYDARDGLRLDHYDFYRLPDAGILEHDFAESIADERVVTVVEWAEVVQGVLPSNRITLRIVATGDDEREVTVTAADVGRLLEDIA